MPAQRIAIYGTGGTISMETRPNGDPHIECSPEEALERIYRLTPELRTIAEEEGVEIVLRPLMSVDSTDMTPSDRITIATAIARDYRDFTGFVVAHGTDTMAYTAACIAFACQELGKPINLTGGQLPLSTPGTDSRTNLVHAFSLATYRANHPDPERRRYDLAETTIVFGDRMLRGVRAQKIDDSAIRAFESTRFPSLGIIGAGMYLSRDCRVRHNRPLRFVPTFDTRAQYVDINDSTRVKDMEHFLLDDNVPGAVIATHGAALVPSRLHGPLEEATARQHKPVVILSKCAIASNQRRIYELAIRPLEFGAINGYDMTPEAALWKLYWALGQTAHLSGEARREEVRAIFSTDLAGEVTLPLRAASAVA